jgi:hypothetical protein
MSSQSGMMDVKDAKIYTSSTKDFTLSYSKNCSTTGNFIACDTFTIDPEAAMIKVAMDKEEVTLNGMSWTKTTPKNGKNRVYYVGQNQTIQVMYKKYSVEAEKAAESIIATFKAV